jgi:hypothetical protein
MAADHPTELAPAPCPGQGETTDNPRAVPKPRSRSEIAMVMKVPAMIAGQSM